MKEKLWWYLVSPPKGWKPIPIDRYFLERGNLYLDLLLYILANPHNTNTILSDFTQCVTELEQRKSSVLPDGAHIFLCYSERPITDAFIHEIRAEHEANKTKLLTMGTLHHFVTYTLQLSKYGYT